MQDLPKTMEDNAHVAREAVGTFVFVFIYAGVVLLLASRMRWLAIALFWLGVALVAGVIFFVLRTYGWMPSGPAPNTRVATIIRVVELSFVLGVLYYLYIDLY
jgi:hypothetical protein